jgi:hypothetical protein
MGLHDGHLADLQHRSPGIGCDIREGV